MLICVLFIITTLVICACIYSTVKLTDSFKERFDELRSSISDQSMITTKVGSAVCMLEKKLKIYHTTGNLVPDKIYHISGCGNLVRIDEKEVSDSFKFECVYQFGCLELRFSPQQLPALEKKDANN